MTVSYDPTNLDTSTADGRLNVVRFLLGDTSTTDANVQDEEIQFSLASASDAVYLAASSCASAIASKYAGYVDTEIDGSLSADYSQLSENFRQLSIQLKQDGNRLDGASLGIFVGGLPSGANENSYYFYRGQFTVDKEFEG